MLTRTPRRPTVRGALLGLIASLIVTVPGLAAGGAVTSGAGAESIASGASVSWASAPGLPAAIDAGAPAGSIGAATNLAVTRVAPVRVALPGVTATPYAAVFRHGPRTRKVIALTFDDGYSPSRTRAIFQILRAEHVMATFFPYARAMKLDPGLWHDIAAAGYPVGNHTYSHADLTRLSLSGAVSEMTLARSTIARITGRKVVPVMRPPYGAYSNATRQAATLAGYPTMVLWDVDSRDWSGISASAIVSRSIVGTSGSIVLLHAGPANTPSALRAIIASYRSRGYTFVTVPQLLGIAWP